MIGSAKFSRDRAYLEENYKEWLKYISKGKKYEPFLATLFIVLGFSFLFFKGFIIVSITGIAIGIFELILFKRHKLKWITNRLKSKNNDDDIFINFFQDYFEIIIPSSNEKIDYKNIFRVKITHRGIFIWLKKGMNLYIPKESITPVESIELIINKLSKIK